MKSKDIHKNYSKCKSKSRTISKSADNSMVLVIDGISYRIEYDNYGATVSYSLDGTVIDTYKAASRSWRKNAETIPVVIKRRVESLYIR